MHDLLSRHYSASEVADAADVPPETIQNWLKRGLPIGLDKISGGGVKGRHRRFSFSNVMEIAIAQHLVVSQTISPARGFEIARAFAFAGDETREIACPYHQDDGMTFIVKASAGPPTILMAEHSPDLSQVPPDYSRNKSFIVVNVSVIFEEVCDRLGYVARSVLDELRDYRAENPLPKVPNQ